MSKTTIQTQDIATLLSKLGQPYVDESATISAPYTTVVNRAKIPDLTNDFKLITPSDRIYIQEVYQQFKESGASGQNVFSPVGDTRNLVRFIGTWSNSISSTGMRVESSTVNDLVEITFYGTGLNLLIYGGVSTDLRLSVDGGSYGGSSIIATNSNVLNGGLHAPYTILPVTSGLSLGIHTVSLKVNSAAALPVAGYEVLNESTTLRLNPGIAYKNGVKIRSTAAQTFAYNTGVTGTRGGRMLIGVDSTGTITRAFTAVDATTKYLTNTDHTNEEMLRSFYPREFGGADSTGADFSFGSGGARRFNLDDASTTLMGSGTSGASVLAVNGVQSVVHDGTGDYITIYFTGTGLDISRSDDVANTTPSTTWQVYVDGVSQGYLNNVGSLAFRTEKIVSGLPYGKHTVTILRNSGATHSMGIQAFHVYQPIKPALSSDSVEIAEYCVVADYSFTASTFGTTSYPDYAATSQGVLGKTARREFNYAGTWTSVASSGYAYGYRLTSSTVSDYVELTFMGTGVEFLSTYTTSGSWTVKIDGVAYTGAATVATGNGSGTWTPGTSTWAMTGTRGARLSITGLTYGKHTVRLTIAAASGALQFQGYEIITPMHMTKTVGPLVRQNVNTISNATSNDLRRTFPAKAEDTVRTNKAIGFLVDPTYASSTITPMYEMMTSFEVKDKPVKITFSACIGGPTSFSAFVYLYVDGIPYPEVTIRTGSQSATPFHFTTKLQLSPGWHNIVVHMNVNGGTMTMDNIRRQLIVEDA